jgi:hypothetical protein
MQRDIGQTQLWAGHLLDGGAVRPTREKDRHRFRATCRQLPYETRRIDAIKIDVQGFEGRDRSMQCCVRIEATRPDWVRMHARE